MFCPDENDVGAVVGGTGFVGGFQLEAGGLLRTRASIAASSAMNSAVVVSTSMPIAVSTSSRPSPSNNATNLETTRTKTTSGGNDATRTGLGAGLGVCLLVCQLLCP